jgi:hypothetical protein
VIRLPVYYYEQYTSLQRNQRSFYEWYHRKPTIEELSMMCGWNDHDIIKISDDYQPIVSLFRNGDSSCCTKDSTNNIELMPSSSSLLPSVRGKRSTKQTSAHTPSSTPATPSSLSDMNINMKADSSMESNIPVDTSATIFLPQQQQQRTVLRQYRQKRCKRKKIIARYPWLNPNPTSLL